MLIGLVATLPARTSLLARAAPSISAQSRQLDALVVVSDGSPLRESVCGGLRELMPRLTIAFLTNSGLPGAAGAWNTGIRFIKRHWADPTSPSYVAILDDDDAWDADHLEACEVCARKNGWPDAVVSGIRTRIDGHEVSRPSPRTLSVDDFLAGNPGWQGSNTFIRLDALVDAGSFTDGLTSCNDRDLAIRMLSPPDRRFAFTGRPTATWILETMQESLSAHRGEAKRTGLKRFFELHGCRMDEAVRSRFFDRALNLFGWSEREILGSHEELGDA